MTALFTREGHSSPLSVLPAAAIFNNYLVIIYTGATIIFNNTCFRGRALTASFLRAVLEMFSISMFCGLSQSHFRLRGSERISEWGRIWVSISVGAYQGNLFCREHNRSQYGSMRLRKSGSSAGLSMSAHEGTLLEFTQQLRRLVLLSTAAR